MFVKEYIDPKNYHKAESKIKIIEHGFKILNVCNYMLVSQEMFNKMGRYHINYHEILNLFLQLIKDLNIYN